MSNKILVTGATGTIGGAVTTYLSSVGENVRAAVRNIDKAKSRNWQGVEIVPFDYENRATFEAALKGVNRLFVMSPPVPNVHELVIPLIDYAKEAGVKHIVDLSTIGAEYDDSTSLRLVEKSIESSEISYTFLRPNWVMQNFNNWYTDSIKENNAIHLPAGDAKTSFVDARDIAGVATAAFTKPGHENKIYTLTGGQALDHYEVASILSKAVGKQIEYVAISDDDMRQGLKSQGWPDAAVEMMIELYQVVRQGAASGITSDISTVLDRNPITFELYAHDYAERWK
ncbi:MAG: hypothetical protein B6242_11975 [Anaerolineaceae bacterium 4572_78]|nr:MAG: hypothetical protein B6242_11975 [Anaerolineaceae bacterium 4572_78]